MKRGSNKLYKPWYVTLTDAEWDSLTCAQQELVQRNFRPKDMAAAPAQHARQEVDRDTLLGLREAELAKIKALEGEIRKRRALVGAFEFALEEDFGWIPPQEGE